MEARKLNVAIVGGGISGLAAAVALLRKGVSVQVFERADTLGEVGAGIHMTPNSLRPLYAMGMEKALKSAGGDVSGKSEYCHMDGTVVSPILTHDSNMNQTYGMHRADLLSILADQLPEDTVITGHQCVGFEQTDEEATLHFANGQTASADLVIAADGIHSVLREFITEPTQPVHSGSVAFRGLMPIDRLDSWRDKAFLVWMGQRRHFMAFPVRGNTMLNYVAFVPTSEETAESWSAHGDPVALAAEFKGWDPRVEHLLSRVESCFWWGLYDREPLPSWTKGRLGLLGDAAHPMLPHLGQGANQGIEDGIALACFLAGKDRREAPQALRAYEEFRRERTAIVQRESRQNGRRYDSEYKDIRQRDEEIANSAKFRKWLYDYDVEKEAVAALQRT